MKASILWPIFGLGFLYFTAVLYAIYRGRGFKSSLKVPFALLTFETKEPTGDPGTAEHQTQALQRSDSTQ